MRAHLTLDEQQMQQAAEEEKRRRHDVMAHVHVFGTVAPAAAPFIQCVAADRSRRHVVLRHRQWCVRKLTSRPDLPASWS